VDSFLFALWPCMVERQLWGALQAEGLLTGVEGTLNDLELETVDDLKFLFDHQIEADEAGLGLQWRWSQQRGSGVLCKAMPLVTPFTPVVELPVYRVKIPKAKFRKKFLKAATPGSDLAKREEAARRAVALSLTWRPKGLASKMSVIDQRGVDRQVRMVARNETAVISAGLSCWQRWTEWCSLNKFNPLDGDAGCWMDFIEQRSEAATMARATWTQAEWLVSKLAAPIPITDIPKPPKRTGLGALRNTDQTPVAEPELLVFLETLWQIGRYK
jgi:hypothetical protein